MLIAARAVQGFGAAIISPAALSIVTTTFTEGAERNKALGVWGAVGGSGAAAGVLIGGVLTKYLGWEWIFFVNVPVGIGALLLTRSARRGEPRARRSARLRPARRDRSSRPGSTLLVYAISQAPDVGWGTVRTIVLLAVSAALLGAFIVVGAAAAAPLVPLGIFRHRTLDGGERRRLPARRRDLRQLLRC